MLVPINLARSILSLTHRRPPPFSSSCSCSSSSYPSDQTRRLGHLWMIFQVVMTLVSCAYFAITSAYKYEAVGLFIEENVFGASVLADLLLRFYASDHR